MRKINVDGVTYVAREDLKSTPKDGKMFCIIRSTNAGVFAGYLNNKNGDEVELLDAIRIWSWSGAASLSQMAMEGVKDPENCKFAMPVKKITVLGVIEIIDTTDTAKKCIESVESWKV